MYEKTMDSPIGKLLLRADEQGLCEVRLLRSGEAPEAGTDCLALEEATRQLEEYFAGTRKTFELPLHAAGTDFERAVWRELTGIPFGEIRTYGQIAARLGKPAASRAVGGACSRNPLLIVVPCHRVVAGTGRLTGFAAGLEAKRTLLAHEGWTIQRDSVIMR